MIFKRRRNQAAESPAEPEDVPTTEPNGEPDSSADDPGAESAGTETTTGDDLDTEALDAAEWRQDGPWDVSEVGLDGEPDDEAEDEAENEDEDAAGQPRIDLGSMLVTGFPGAELRLQVSEETQQVVSVMLISGDSAIELGAYAAPRTGGFWPELREELTEAATEAGGSAALVEGPFGVELRRLLPVTTPDGEQGYQPSRMWVVEGPRWLLRGILYGQAALEDGIDGPVAPLVTAFRQVIVRRDAQAMAPGDLLPLELPKDLTPAEPT